MISKVLKFQTQNFVRLQSLGCQAKGESIVFNE